MFRWLMQVEVECDSTLKTTTNLVFFKSIVECLPFTVPSSVLERLDIELEYIHAEYSGLGLGLKLLAERATRLRTASCVLRSSFLLSRNLSRTLLSFASSVVSLRSRHDRVALSPRVLQHSCGNARPILRLNTLVRLCQTKILGRTVQVGQLEKKSC